MTTVEAMRLVAALVGGWNVVWSWRGPWDLARGRFWPPSFYLTVVCWMSLTAISFQVTYLVGTTPIWRMFSFSMLISALIVAAIGTRRGYAERARVLYGMVDHLGEALAITDLARADPAAATRLADEARRLTVAALVTRRG